MYLCAVHCILPNEPKIIKRSVTLTFGGKQKFSQCLLHALLFRMPSKEATTTTDI